MDYKAVLFLICALVVFSYLFDSVARKTRFPAVILLIGLGITLRFSAQYFGYSIPYLDGISPSLGKLGLILIVLEGALELRITRENRSLIAQSFLSALILLLLNAFVLVYLFHHYLGVSGFRLALIYAIPLSVISSAVAIPSALGLSEARRTFVVYESTFSDILGIIFFNFALNNHVYNLASFAKLGGQTLAIFILSIAVAYFLLTLLNRIEHHVHFFLILSISIIFYLIGDKLQLLSLVLIFSFGLSMSNLKSMVPRSLRKYTEHLHKSEEELHRFHRLSAESAFLVGTFFFLAFSYSIQLAGFSDPEDYLCALIALSLLFTLRFVYFYIVGKKRQMPVAFIAPRGLISTLLFLSIPLALRREAASVIDENFLFLIILGSMFVMMYGSLRFGEKRPGGELREEADKRYEERSQIDKQTRFLPGY